jgi:hypothetical protein
MAKSDFLQVLKEKQTSKCQATQKSTKNMGRNGLLVEEQNPIVSFY